MRKSRPDAPLSPSFTRAATNAVPARQHGACPYLPRCLFPRGGRSRGRLASRVARRSPVPRIAKRLGVSPSPRDARDRDRARGRRPGDARRAAAAATGSSVCHVAVAASRPALARSPRGRGGVPSRGPRGGPLRVFLFLLADDDARLGRAPSLFVSRRLSDLFLISPCLSSPSSYPHSPLRSRPPRPRR